MKEEVFPKVQKNAWKKNFVHFAHYGERGGSAWWYNITKAKKEEKERELSTVLQ